MNACYALIVFGNKDGCPMQNRHINLEADNGMAHDAGSAHNYPVRLNSNAIYISLN